MNFEERTRASADGRKANKRRKRQVYSVKSIYKGKEKDQDKVDFSTNWEREDLI